MQSLWLVSSPASCLPLLLVLWLRITLCQQGHQLLHCQHCSINANIVGLNRCSPTPTLLHHP
jgi:hypothetical protein